ncbi:MAG TPA: GNAT family N-acetyltransferase [Nocardioides sp.]|nr:GNAT family N-acetyltransferase [Nocardioides sp.]
MPAVTDVRIERVDPLELDLDTADALAEAMAEGHRRAGLVLPVHGGPAFLQARRLGSDNRPLDGLWVAWVDGTPVAHADLELPWRENTSAAFVRGHVHPDHRRAGIGRRLWDTAVGEARGAGRARVYSGALDGTPGGPTLEAWGLVPTDGRYAVRRIDLHATPTTTWRRLVDECEAPAADYELVRLAGPTPEELRPGMALLHEAINDAPANDEDEEPMLFDEQRVRDYDDAMAARRQTVYRVLARHRTSGEWAGLSMLCVDEFGPTVAFQEDTSVVRAHRGHRLGLLMKADMLRWITEDRPEVAAVDTWNAITNHHMIAVNERLGARVVAHFQGYRLDL